MGEASAHAHLKIRFGVSKSRVYQEHRCGYWRLFSIAMCTEQTYYVPWEASNHQSLSSYPSSACLLDITLLHYEIGFGTNNVLGMHRVEKAL